MSKIEIPICRFLLSNKDRDLSSFLHHLSSHTFLEQSTMMMVGAAAVGMIPWQWACSEKEHLCV